MIRQYNFREAEKILRNNGYSRISTKGSHHKYRKNSDIIIINLKIQQPVFQRLIKEHNLIVK
jgi:predicted RNA binding protein YcfA (HicA-like mRNA interferase family)